MYIEKSTLTLAVHTVIACLVCSTFVHALPKQPLINGGQATISTGANAMVVQQHTDRVSIDYQGFDIGAHESVVFQQPSVHSIALNRVVGNNASQILGTLQSNGQLFLVNPNGIVFGQGAHVDVGGLVATTLNINDEDFFNGKFHFSGESTGSINNDALIEAAENGLLAFVSREVINNGDIIANGGRIELHAANDITLNMSGDAVSIESNSATLDALIENHGLIQSDGGHIVFNANALEALEQTVVNNTGVIKAARIEEQGGEIFIVGTTGDLILDGELNTNGIGQTDAGHIQLESNRIAVLGNINANGDLLGNGGDVRITADDTIVLAHDASVSANAGSLGDGGEIIAYSPSVAIFQEGARLEAKGGAESGHGGFIEVSGLERVEIYGVADTSAEHGEVGTFYIDPYDITISSAGSANGAFDAANPNSWEGAGVGATSTINTGAITSALSSTDVIINTALNDGTGPGTGTGNITVSDNIDLNGGHGNTLSLIADNDITLAAGVKIQDLTPGTVDAVNVNLTAGNDIILNNDSDIFTTGGNATVSAGGKFDTFGSSSIQTGTGLIDITANDVSLIGLLRSSSTADNAITIRSSDRIVDAGAPSIDIEALNGGVVFQAVNGISLDAKFKKADITNTAGGTVTLDTNNAVEFTDIDVAGDFMLTSGNSDITISGFTRSQNLSLNTGGNLTVNDSVLVDVGAHTIDLDATGNITVTGLITSNATATAIDINAGGQIIDGGNANLDINASTGTITLTADGGIDADIDANLLSVTNTTGGNVSINDADSFTLSNLNTVADAEISAGADLTLGIGSIALVTNLTLDAIGLLTIPDAGIVLADDIVISAGDIVDVSGRDINLAADNLFLDITSLAANTTFNSSVNTLDANFGGAGSVTVSNDADIQLIDSAFDVNSNALTFGTSNVDILSTGNISISNNIDLDGTNGTTLMLEAGFNFFLGDGITIRDSATGSVDTTNLVVEATNDITMGANSIIDVTAGTVSLNADSNSSGTGIANISSVITANASTSALYIHGNEIHDATAVSDDLQAVNGRITLDSLSTIGGGVGGSIDTLADRLVIISNGDVAINQGAQNLNIESIAGANNLTVDAQGAVQVPDAGINVSINSLSITATDIIDSDRIVNLTAGTLILNTQTTGGASTFNTTVSSLDLTNTGSSQVTVNETDNLALVNGVMSSGDLTVSAGNDLTIQTNDIELEGVNGQTLILSAGNNLDVNINIRDSVGGGNNDTDIQLLAGNDITMATGTEINAGAGQIQVVATGGDANIGRLASTNSSSNAIQISSGGQITDRFTGTNLVASNGGAVLRAVNGINNGSNALGTNLSQLSITNTTSGEVRIAETDDIQINSLDVTGTSTLTRIESLGGSLVIPVSSNVTGALHLIAAADINDGDHNLTFTTMDTLSLNLGAPVGNLNLNTDVNNLQVVLGAASDLLVTETNDLNLVDVAGLGAAIQLSSGDFTLSTLGGDINVQSDVSTAQGDISITSIGNMEINALVSASDTLNDGVREGLIDLGVNGGDFNFGNTGAASLISTNTVDQSSGGGLGSTVSDQVAIRIQQLSNDLTIHSFNLGDGLGSDALISAVGGDIYINNIGSLDNALRPITTNSDLTIETFNNIADAATGSVSINNLTDNGATFLALAGRSLQINSAMQVNPPVIIPPTTPIIPVTPSIPDIEQDQLDTIISDIVINAENDTGASKTEGNTPNIEDEVQADEQRVARVFNRAFSVCQGGDNKAQDGTCRTERSLVKFLDAFLIGGELPATGN